MIVNINGVNYISAIATGLPFSKRVGSTLSSGTIVIINSSVIPFKPFSLCEITFDDSSVEYMFTAGDKVDLYSKGNGKYQHTITIVELTKIAEKFFAPKMILTGLNSTISSQINSAITKINSYITSGKYKFILGSGVEAKLLSYPISGEKIVLQKATAREIFDTILSAINSRLKITSVSTSLGITRLYIDFIDLNEITDIAHDFSAPVFISMNNNCDDYCGQIISFISNASPQTYIRQIDTFKVNYGEAIATTDNRIISLAYPIEFIKDFKLCYVDNLNITFFTSEDPNNSQTVPLDMSNLYVYATDKLVDKEYWNTLLLVDQEQTLYYTQGTESIDVSRTYKPLLTTKSSLDAVFNSVLLREATNNWSVIESEIKRQYPNLSEYTLTFDHFSDVSSSVEKALFDITYAPLVETELIVDKDLSTEIDEALTIVDNQSDNVIDIDRYGRNLLGKLLRTGNDELYIDDIVYSHSDILEPLSRITFNGKYYVIYQTDYQIMYNCAKNYDWYKVRYYLSENYNNISEKIGIKRIYEKYQIPLTGYQTPIFNTQILTVKNDYSGNIILNYSLARYLAETLCNNTDSNSLLGKRITHALVTATDGDLTSRLFYLPVLSFGAGNNIYFVAKFYDNLSAGLSINTDNHNIFDWIGGKKVVYNPYVNEYGEAYSFSAKYGYFGNPTPGAIQRLPKYDASYSADFNEVIDFTFPNLVFPKDIYIPIW